MFVHVFLSAGFLSRGHATLHLAALVRPFVHPSIRPSVHPSVRHIFELQAVKALLLLPNHTRMDCCVTVTVKEAENKVDDDDDDD